MKIPLKARTVMQILTNIFFLWVIYTYALGGWETGIALLANFGWFAYLMLFLVSFLVFFRSDWRIDLPLFLAGFALGYWGEWWGTTRGVWTYWNGAQPPAYLPPLWGIGLLTVFRLSQFFLRWLPGEWSSWFRRLAGASLIFLPMITLLGSSAKLMEAGLPGRVDIHFFAGLFLAAGLILYRFELRESFAIFVCGLFLGGVYETLGTRMGEWRYITGEAPPLWIAPLWGLAALAMVKLSRLLIENFHRLLSLAKSLTRDSYSQY